jgi:hypothetical protein
MKKLILSTALFSFLTLGFVVVQASGNSEDSKTKTACCKKGDAHKSCKKDAKVCAKDSAKCAKEGKKCDHSKK